MAFRADPFFGALATAWLSLCPGVVDAQELMTVEFSGGSHAVAFAVNGGRDAVTLAVPGRDPSSARLGSATKVVDPVSRLIIFRTEGKGAAYRLAERAPTGGLLRTADGEVGCRIEGRVEQVSGKFLPFTVLKLRYDGDAPEPGMPLLDAAGGVAAIAHEGVEGDVGYALPVEVIHRALDAEERGGKVRRAWLGVTLDPSKKEPEVKKVRAGSPAAKGGMKPGDILLEIGGRGIGDYGDAVNAFFLLRPGKATKVKLRRGEAEMEAAVVPVVAKS